MGRRGKRTAKATLGDVRDLYGFARLSADYWDALRLKNYSEATIENRRRYLESFIRWCEARSVTRPREVTKPMLERYQRHLYHHRKANGAPMSFRNQNAHLIAVRAFFRWATRANHLLYNPASDIELPKLEHRLPRAVLTAREAEAVLSQPDIADGLGLRDRAMLEVLYATGMRRGELIQLTLYSLDAERGTVLSRQGKGKRDRMVPISKRAIDWIEKYLREVRPTLVIAESEQTLFLTSTGEALTPNRLTQVIRGYVRAAQLGKSGSCHLFRHTMATLMLEGGADIRFIQAMLGHVELSTTQIYTHVSIRKLKEIHEATHPGAGGGAKALANEAHAELGVDAGEELHAALAADGAAEDESREP
jgi:integrase/recombinase XerD